MPIFCVSGILNVLYKSMILLISNYILFFKIDTQIEKGEYVKIRKLSFDRLNPGVEMSDDAKSDIEREV